MKFEDKDESTKGTVDIKFEVESLDDLIKYCKGISGDKEERAKSLQLQLKAGASSLSQKDLHLFNSVLETLTTESTLFEMLSILAEEVKEIKEKK